ncbi:MAG: SurA N-terminal domain-containing protein, partial [Sphingomicrobium sp.]
MPEVSRPIPARAWRAIALSAAVIASAAAAQEAPAPAAAQPGPEAVNSAQSLRLPSAPQVFGSAMPSVVKATAIINGDIITQTDIDQRLALLAIANGGQIPTEEIDRLREQVLRNLIDETLQIQAAKTAKIEIKPSEIDRTFERVAANIKQTPAGMETYLAANGSSMNSMRRQIEGELSWQRLQRAKIESSINVGEDEVKAVLDRM